MATCAVIEHCCSSATTVAVGWLTSDPPVAVGGEGSATAAGGSSLIARPGSDWGSLPSVCSERLDVPPGMMRSALDLWWQNGRRYLVCPLHSYVLPRGFCFYDFYLVFPLLFCPVGPAFPLSLPIGSRTSRERLSFPVLLSRQILSYHTSTSLCVACIPAGFVPVVCVPLQSLH